MAKTALITGTTSGIGKALAEKFAQEQHILILVSRDEHKLKMQADELSAKYNIAVHIFPIDLVEIDAARKVFEFVQKLKLNIEILVNNAGFTEHGAFSDNDLQKEIEMIQLHIIFTTEMIKCFLPKMLENNYGRIMNLGSTSSYIPCPYDAVYAATKAYILSMSKGLSSELKGTGVSITVLCPGPTKTEFAHKAGMENTLLFKIFVMTPEAVAHIGYNALIKRKVAVTTGLYNKLLVFLSKISPASIVSYSARVMLKG